MNSVIVKLASGILGGLFVAFICYGSYRFYFDKPVPIINNTIVQSGGKVEVAQGNKTIGVKGHLVTGVAVGQNELLGTVAWIW